MNTRHSLVTISRFKLEDPIKTQELKSALRTKKTSYLALKSLKENYNSYSHEKSPLSARLTQRPLDKEKENQSPFHKPVSVVQNLNKSLSQISINKSNKNKIKTPEKSEKAQKTCSKSKSPNVKGFKIFKKTGKSKLEQQKSEQIAKDFISFQENAANYELKDITNSQNFSYFESFNDEDNNEAQNEFQKDPNVMTLKQLKEENEEELKEVLKELNKKKERMEIDQEIIEQLEGKRADLNQEYQDLIKGHSLSLQAVQGDLRVFEERNHAFNKNIEMAKDLIKNKKVDQELKETQKSFYENEKLLKEIQQTNENKSQDLFEKIKGLNEEITNYEDLREFKRRGYENAKKELLKKIGSIEQNSKLECEKNKLENEKREKLFEKRNSLFEKKKNLERKNIEIQEKRKECNELKAKLSVSEIIIKEIEAKNNFIQSEKTKLNTELKNQQLMSETLLDENFSLNEKIIGDSDTNSKTLDKTPTKPQKRQELARLTKKKKDINKKIKELFDEKLVLENQKIPTNSHRGILAKKDQENLELEKAKTSEMIAKQAETIKILTAEVNNLKEQRDEDKELLESLKIGVSKQKLIISSKTSIEGS